ncbi:N-myristoyltransferase [Indivirus ILV1]|uniref:glycylpeptide N-tetradecanoyltransferase n=1 Tax=Indivirus ILV1 TaxID=1977633 RepID=A0A1V0SD55_9VIRU|nr:N-myristoyltransferase [Indivirus ILV1]
MNQTQYPKNLESATKYEYKFWNTQPMTKIKEHVTVDTEFNNETLSNQQESLPDGFVWMKYDFSKFEDKQKISLFLSKFYGLDSSAEFSKQYNETYLDWLSNERTYIALGVEYKLATMGFIYGHVQKTQVNRRQLDIVEVNLACIHPKLRNKNLLPRLITELRRQFDSLGYKYGTFSTVNYMSKPFCSSVAWNRVIGAKVLIDTGFIKLDQSLTLEMVKNSSRLPSKLDIENYNFKKMDESHIDRAYELFNNYMDKYNVHPIFNKDDFKREFYNNKFINTFVVENSNGQVLDFFSYYTLTTNVLKNNTKHKNIKRGYLYYYTCQNLTPYKLLQNILILVKTHGVDVFTALDNMENMYVLRELGFDETSTTYHQYMYNLKIPTLQNTQVARIYS